MTKLFDLEALRGSLAAAPDAERLGRIGLQNVVIADGALASLPETVDSLVQGADRSGPVVVLSDTTPKACASGDLLESVTGLLARGSSVRPVLLGTPGHLVHADEQTLATASAESAGAACIVAVGSGTIADIGKVLAASHHVPYVVVQTAGSVNGFADDRSVLLVNGVKRTVQSTWADALIADSDVIARAPVEMNVSGLGDLIAMFTAPADWYLATILGMDDSYSPSVVALTRDQGPTLLGTAHLLPRADRTAIGQLVATLTASGISMGVAGTTAPSSGMEHAVGHLIDMASVQANEDTVLHGSQVGATSIVAALLWQRVLGELSSGGLKRLKVPDALEAEADLRAAFSGVDPTGEMGEECWRDYERKLALWAKAGEHIEHAADNWATHEETLRHLLAGPGELVAALRSARAAVGFGELTPPVSPDDVRWAVTNCRFLRNRLSIADAAVFLGIWDDAYIDALLEDAAALAGVA